MTSHSTRRCSRHRSSRWGEGSPPTARPGIGGSQAVRVPQVDDALSTSAGRFERAGRPAVRPSRRPSTARLDWRRSSGRFGQATSPSTPESTPGSIASRTSSSSSVPGTGEQRAVRVDRAEGALQYLRRAEVDREIGLDVVVLAFEPREPGFDLALPEAELAADPEAGRSAALAPQVIERRRADRELGGELGDREDRLEGVPGGVCGVHDTEVGEAHRAGRDRPRERAVSDPGTHEKCPTNVQWPCPARLPRFRQRPAGWWALR